MFVVGIALMLSAFCHIVCIYAEPFRKLTTLKKVATTMQTLKKVATTMQHIWYYCRCPWGNTAHATHFYKALFMGNICLADSMYLSLELL